MGTSFITTFILLTIWGVFKLWERWRRSKTDKTLERVMAVQAASYSVMVMLTRPSIEIKTMLEELMKAAGYEITGIKIKKESFDRWNDDLYFDTAHLKKGLVELAGAVVFNDPESVIITNRQAMEKLSEEGQCTVLVAIWERVSSTVIFEGYVNGQLQSATQATAFRPDPRNMNPDRELLKRADGDRLKVRLMKKAVDTRLLFDKTALNIVEYQLNDRFSQDHR